MLTILLLACDFFPIFNVLPSTSVEVVELIDFEYIKIIILLLKSLQSIGMKEDHIIHNILLTP